MAKSHESIYDVRRTPHQHRAQESVHAVLQAAAAIIEESGYEAYNTNAVAKRAGVSVALVYRYFPNKESILIALWEREQEPRNRCVLDLIHQIPSITNFDEYGRTIIDSLRQVRKEHPSLTLVRKILPSVPEVAVLEDAAIQGCADLLNSKIKIRFPAIPEGEAAAATVNLLSLIPPLVDATLSSMTSATEAELVESSARLLATFFKDLESRFK